MTGPPQSVYDRGMATYWEREQDGTTHYASLGPDGLLIGSHGGSGHSDNAGSCTVAEFLAGNLHEAARAGLGEQALAAMIATAEELIGA